MELIDSDVELKGFIKENNAVRPPRFNCRVYTMGKGLYYVPDTWYDGYKQPHQHYAISMVVKVMPGLTRSFTGYI